MTSNKSGYKNMITIHTDLPPHLFRLATVLFSVVYKGDIGVNKVNDKTRDKHLATDCPGMV
jgi:hypothetical protein